MALIPAGIRSALSLVGRIACLGGLLLGLGLLVETGKPTLGGRFALWMMGLTSAFTPKQCRAELWPFDRDIGKP